MKHLFIINPVSGKGENEKKFLPKLIKFLKEKSIDYEIHRTMGPKDAENFVLSKGETKEDYHIFACGGDGTLNEVINGAYGFSNLSIGVIPIGTGNDFVKSFPDPKSFLNLERQLVSIPTKMDVMRVNKKIAINMCNIGFDSAVVNRVNHIKQGSFLAGSFAYISAAAAQLIEGLGIELDIRIDDEALISGIFTLCAAGKGKSCGGGFLALPKVVYDDGFLDLCIVNKVSRKKLALLVGAYHRGAHVESKRFQEIVFYKKCKKIEITTATPLFLSVDGEISTVNEVLIEVIPKGINFLIP